MRIADGRTIRAAAVAAVRSPRLLLHLATFVRRTVAFKAGQDPTTLAPLPGFTPESTKGKKGYQSPPVDPICDHPHIVNALEEDLRRRGMVTGNKKHAGGIGKPDLYVTGVPQYPNLMFEVKTACDLDSIYHAVGQLTLYTASQAGVRRILVLPEGWAEKRKLLLRALGFQILEYQWTGPKPHFPELARLLVSASRM